ncbi:MAG: 23S rRNA (adenine(2503)-C(2))-methyltransferase RlmN [Bacteroidales bacterium]|nr:23S rRNA (adenine(2503)-C(2))-methyltransferase RlmN [Bacteroidales bacterium]
MQQKPTLIGKSLTEMQALVAALGMPKFAAKQILRWIYVKRVASFDAMTDISAANRALLSEHYVLGRVAPVHEAVSVDGTKKYLFQTANGLVETVYIPEDERATLCVSCQVGCKMNCRFCMTGKQGWSGNLTAAEILNQILSVPDSASLTNIVFMGMGEPFDNTLEILKTLEILTADWAMAWSPRRITVSSVGLLPGLKQFLEHSEAHLAISLHNPFPDGRAALMPAEKAYPIERVVAELKKHDFAHQRRVSFEYIVFEGVNDSPRHQRQIVRLLAGLPCRVNLIRFHAIPDLDLHSPSLEAMTQMRDYLTDNGVICTIRRSRGEDIAAACGLLSSNNPHD